LTQAETKAAGEGRAAGIEAWYALAPGDALARLAATEAGLGSAEAARRLAIHGPNRLPEPAREAAWRRFLAQFHNVLIYVLLAAACVTAWLGHGADTGVILGVVILNAVIGYVQEGKAQSAIEAVRNMLSLHAIVLRDGRKCELDAGLLVPGDIVFLQSGDKVPADLRLLHARGLRAIEAALTGESAPTDKAVAAAQADAPLSQRESMAHAGTVIAAGQGLGVVVATGLATEIGRVSKLLVETEALQTPLLRRLDAMGRRLTLAVLALAAATFSIGVFLRGLPAADMFMAAVGLTVAAIPEGLPAIITIALVIGVERMAQRNAIVRRLPAVETLGSVTTICTDKTGTLTHNELAVRAVHTPDGRFDVTGTGYAPAGEIRRYGEGTLAARDKSVQALLGAGALCNDAAIHKADGAWRLAGDPTEGALLTAAMKADIDPAALARAHPRLDEIPFDAAHRFMATLHRDGTIYLKGAPEAVLERCVRERAASGERPVNRQTWRRTAEAAAAQGMRVLALASKAAPAGHRTLSMADTRDGFVLLGVAAMIDPPRPEAIAAVADCRRAGIRVAMITGDHAETARAIAREIGLVDGDRDRVLSGAEIEAMDDGTLAQAARAMTVVARADPEHKLRLVEALQANSEVVAMTGDGANDAPALKRADVGVAMGRKGTDAAKEASVMVLADDNFATIAEAVRQGRGVYDNLRKTLMFILPTDLGEALLVAIAVLVGGTMPVTPVQIMWINLVTSVTLALALVLEQPEADVMRRKPRPAAEPILSGFVLWRIAFVGSLMLVAAFTLFHGKIATGASVEAARTVAVNAVVACEAFYLVPARFLLASGLSRHALGGIGPALLTIALTMLCQVGFTYLPPVQALFGTAGLSLADWGWVLLAGVTVLVLAEAEKAVLRTLNARRGGVRPASA
jgi:magnesium-transporting ATPase (P-type)